MGKPSVKFFSKKVILLPEYQLILTFSTIFFATITVSGCAHSPLMKQWDWSIRPDYSKTLAAQKASDAAFLKQAEQVYKRNKSWKNTANSDVLYVDYYDENGVKTGSATVR